METKLLIKNFPQKFSGTDKQDFLKLFGSKSVTCLYGKLQNSCFAEFPDVASTQQALETLHQFEVLGQRLVAEYAKPVHKELASKIEAQKAFEKTVFETDEKTKKEKTTTKNQENELGFPVGIASNLGLNHNFPNHLNYKYPEPTVQILTNIANALATIPKFYTLVLHLMNKMNLPPPFTGSTPTPPVQGDSVNLHDACVDTFDLHTFVSSDESEIESDSETKKHEIYQHSQTATELGQKRKRLRTVAQFNQQRINASKTKHSDLPVQSAFELGSSVKRLEFKLGASIKEAVEKKSQPQINYNVFDERGQFGKIEPLHKIQEPMLESDEECEKHSSDEESPDYISSKQLHDNRITKEAILAMNQFKNYKEGDQTNRLYVKNLGKQVTESDLLYIFKRFLLHRSEEEKHKLEIRLMQEGRMKGQAFVTFPDEKIAENALKATHGYVLQDKPMVIQYGRSGK